MVVNGFHNRTVLQIGYCHIVGFLLLRHYTIQHTIVRIGGIGLYHTHSIGRIPLVYLRSSKFRGWNCSRKGSLTTEAHHITVYCERALVKWRFKSYCTILHSCGINPMHLIIIIQNTHKSVPTYIIGIIVRIVIIPLYSNITRGRSESNWEIGRTAIITAEIIVSVINFKIFTATSTPETVQHHGHLLSFRSFECISPRISTGNYSRIIAIASSFIVERYSFTR